MKDIIHKIEFTSSTLKSCSSHLHFVELTWLYNFTLESNCMIYIVLNMFNMKNTPTKHLHTHQQPYNESKHTN